MSIKLAIISLSIMIIVFFVGGLFMYNQSLERARVQDKSEVQVGDVGDVGDVETEGFVKEKEKSIVETKKPVALEDEEKMERDEAILEKYNFSSEDENVDNQVSDNSDELEPVIITDEEKAEQDEAILEKYNFSSEDENVDNQVSDNSDELDPAEMTDEEKKERDEAILEKYGF